MPSPNNGQPVPPPGYILEVNPPPGYVLDTPQTVQVALPNQILQQVLDENKGLAKNFNTGNTSVVLADPQRSERGLKERGGLEFWDKGDKGDDDYPSPDPSKNVLEIYSDDLKKNPEALKQAIYGDLMHGMAADPYWKNLRTSFMQNFTKQELERQQQKNTWWNDVNGEVGDDSPSEKFGPTYDAYIRGWIGNEGEGRQGQEESGNTMYSPEQLNVLQKMTDYLKTGENPESPPPVKPALPNP